jgi:small ligand-binding sensory domain FIST
VGDRGSGLAEGSAVPLGSVVTAAATTYVHKGQSAARIAAGLIDSFRSARSPSAGLVFLGGSLGDRVQDIAEALAQAGLGFPLLVASGSGVITERGELEAEPAATALAFRGGSPEAIVTTAANHDDAASALANRLTALSRGSLSTALVFVQAKGFSVDAIEPLLSAKTANLVGAGTPDAAPIAAIDREGRLGLGILGALLMRGLTPARIRSSPACRLLMPLRPITAARGPLLSEIAGTPALEVLQGAAAGLEGQPLILTVLAPEPKPDEGGRSELIVRGIQGVDPARQAIVLSGELKTGWRVAFAVRDAAAARADLELCTRDLARESAGAAPLFGVYVSCSGRGSALYDSPDVDLRVLRGRFPEVPLIGLHSAFEIAPFDGRAAVHFYTGVLALFTAPS